MQALNLATSRVFSCQAQLSKECFHYTLSVEEINCYWLGLEVFFINQTCQSKGKAIDFIWQVFLRIASLLKDFSNLIES